MATENVTNATADKAAEYLLNFGAARNLFALSRQATADDVQAQLSARLSQLSAMLDMTYGAGYQAFKEYNETTQENYLWGCAAAADECENLLCALGELRRIESAAQ